MRRRSSPTHEVARTPATVRYRENPLTPPRSDGSRRMPTHKEPPKLCVAGQTCWAEVELV